VSDPQAYFYAVIRVVPRVERGECINAGVVLFSRSLRFLGMEWTLDPWKLQAISPDTDPDFVESHLVAMAAVANGDPDGGPVAQMERAERFHWLVAPSSTIVQPSPVHTGVTTDPAATLSQLFAALVE
jgi:hypothetical protein